MATVAAAHETLKEYRNLPNCCQYFNELALQDLAGRMSNFIKSLRVSLRETTHLSDTQSQRGDFETAVDDFEASYCETSDTAG